MNQTVEHFSNVIGTDYQDRIETLKAYTDRVIEKMNAELYSTSGVVSNYASIMNQKTSAN
jgi:hypothetical protein